MTATVSAEAGIVFAKASTSIGVTVGASYSWTDTFSYSKTSSSANGKYARLHLYKAARKFTVSKMYYDSSLCKYRPAYTSTVIAPVLGSGGQVWRLDYTNVP